MPKVICQHWKKNDFSFKQTIHLTEQDRLLFIFNNQHRIKDGETPADYFIVEVEDSKYNDLILHQPLHGVEVSGIGIKCFKNFP